MTAASRFCCTSDLTNDKPQTLCCIRCIQSSNTSAKPLTKKTKSLTKSKGRATGCSRASALKAASRSAICKLLFFNRSSTDAEHARLNCLKVHFNLYAEFVHCFAPDLHRPKQDLDSFTSFTFLQIPCRPLIPLHHPQHPHRSHVYHDPYYSAADPSAASTPPAFLNTLSAPATPSWSKHSSPALLLFFSSGSSPAAVPSCSSGSAIFSPAHLEALHPHLSPTYPEAHPDLRHHPILKTYPFTSSDPSCCHCPAHLLTGQS